MREVSRKAPLWNGKRRKAPAGHRNGRGRRSYPVRPQAGALQKRREEAGMPDYGSYVLQAKDILQAAAEYMAAALAVSLLFFRSWLVFLAVLPGFAIYMKRKRKELAKKREARMRVEFLDGMQFAGTALASGYAMENAFAEADIELRKIYDEDSFIVREFHYITVQTRMNVPLEELLTGLGDRSHIDDIRNFSNVFVTARRTGGDMIAIVRNTISDMQQKEETRQEIETVIAGKKMECRIMSAVPLVILGYVSLTDPGFLKGMYHTPAGITIMSGCLAVYAAAFWWAGKIMDIRI